MRKVFTGLAIIGIGVAITLFFFEGGEIKEMELQKKRAAPDFSTDSSISVSYSSSSSSSLSYAKSGTSDVKQNLIYFNQDTTKRYEVLVIAKEPTYEKPPFSKDILIEGHIKGAGKYIIKVPKDILESSGFTIQIMDLKKKKRVAQFDEEFLKDIFEGDKKIILDVDPTTPSKSNLQVTQKERILPVP